MLYLFDLDKTLIRSYMDDPPQERNFMAVEVLPGRKEKLAEILAGGNKIAIITNQGGVGLGYHLESEFWQKAGSVLAALGLPVNTLVLVCFAHKGSKREEYRTPAELKRRKPAPGMILEAITHNRVHAGTFGTIMIGDSAEDRNAAAAAGVQFAWAGDFFGDRPATAEEG
jgi:D-glycero-D-manno-heptose 1,7-bisphosphate phosphatase